MDPGDSMVQRSKDSSQFLPAYHRHHGRTTQNMTTSASWPFPSAQHNLIATLISAAAKPS
jgi:hypothetical protein